MELAEIAAGIEVCTQQTDRGVVAVDGTDRSLADRLDDVAEQLPCTPAAAATVVHEQTRGVSIETAAREANVPPVTAAKVLHRCGVAGVTPVGPTGRAVVRDWLAGELGRHEAVTLVGCTNAEFTLAAYCETHDPIPAAVEAAATLDSAETAATKRDRLAETMSQPSELR